MDLLQPDFALQVLLDRNLKSSILRIIPETKKFGNKGNFKEFKGSDYSL